MLGGITTAGRWSGVARRNSGGTRQCHHLPPPLAEPTGGSEAPAAAALHHCAQVAQADETFGAFGCLKQLLLDNDIVSLGGDCAIARSVPRTDGDPNR